MIKKRLVIGFNGILLVLFLDICLLIFIRSVDQQGNFQTMADKWESLSFVSILYGTVLAAELALYAYMRYRRKHAAGLKSH